MKALSVLFIKPGQAEIQEIDTNSFHRAIKLLDRGTFNLSKLITHRHAVADVQAAMELASLRPAEYIKGVLMFDGFSQR